MTVQVQPATVEVLLRLMPFNNASDLHLAAGVPPAFRIHGNLTVAGDVAPMSADAIRDSLDTLLDAKQREAFSRDLELDFAVELEGAGRFRGNAALERGRISLVFRRITELALDFEGLGLPPVAGDLAQRPRGLVIVTGPAGSGKSTTLAAMIEHINTRASRRVVTMEDPIEYLFTSKGSLITQREVGQDTRSFRAALDHVLRQNPDVIMVGETRDAETVAATLTAAETGHLVMTSAHAPGAPQTVERIIDLFPPYQQDQVRAQLAATLEAVLYQTLLPKADGKGRVLAVEVMLGTYAVRNLIREGKTHQLYSTIQLGANQGMRTLDQALLELYRQGAATSEAVLAACRDRQVMERELATIKPKQSAPAASDPSRPKQPAPRG